jgi:hypothetical protein
LAKYLPRRFNYRSLELEIFTPLPAAGTMKGKG